ncbi:MAG TPA: sugar ABC transporter permease [Clostridiaceae bacterium]|nr:sugar ABC transporter permease [Clostridiaceae bacterium]
MKVSRRFKENLIAYFFIGPNFIGFTTFIILPVILTLVVSFTEWQFTAGLKGMKFIGLKNYIDMWKDDWFISSIKNNLYYTLGTVPVTMVLALLSAVALNKYVFGKNIIRLMFFLPYISNIVVVSTVWFIMYADTGPITKLIEQLGVKNPPYWLADVKWAMPAIILMTVWMNLGYTMVIYLAGLQNIPNDLYEACEIDGANAIQKFRHITIPALSPTTFFILITSIINSFKVFGQINIMTQGGPGTSTTVLVYYIYQAAFKFWKIGYASAISWVLFIIIFTITLIQWKGQKKWVNYM